MLLEFDAFVLDSPLKCHASGPGLYLTAKRYTVGASGANTEGLTLFLAHCVGSRECLLHSCVRRWLMLSLRRQRAMGANHRAYFPAAAI